jgi:cyclic 2,3-diphosphoglycerate synthetase
VIDGEHYASVVRDALAELPYDVVACVLVGGSEKLRGGEHYGVPLRTTVEEAIAEHAPDVVLDLSDEPVLGPPARFRLAGRVLACGVPYEGADFRFDPPRFEAIGRPSIAVIGTGKRVGKTAVVCHAAQVFARERRVIVVAMGRGGPGEPEVVEVRPTVEDLLDRSRTGRHAASDHLETAALTGLPTVGCRRCGGGLAGAVGISNVVAGARLAVEMGPDLIVLDGSGAAIPPIAADRRILVVGAHQDVSVATGYLNPYRALLADLIVVAMAEDGVGHASLADSFRELAKPGVPVVRVVLRPRPLGNVRGRRIAFFGTVPAAQRGQVAAHLEAEYGADVVHVSGSLSDRAALHGELSQLGSAEAVVVEVKAAAIDVVAEHAARLGLPVILAGNDVVPLPGEPDLDLVLESLAADAIASPPVVV